MVAKHSENAFETEIVRQMVASKEWMEGDSRHYNRQRCLYAKDLTDFVQLTQPEEWARLTTAVGGDPSTQFQQDVSQAITSRGTLDVLRNAFDTFGCRFTLAFFPPSSSRNEDLIVKFRSNIFTVIRQLKYSEKNENSIDLVLFLNGIPLFTSELKNQLTKQDVHDAVRQYRTNRLPAGEPFLQFGRCLAHFAVDLMNVKVSTHLKGFQSKFLPFDKGNSGGAGNPVKTILNAYPTSYLWNNTWSRTTIMNLLQHFMLHEQVKKPKKRGKTKELGTLIFPRYHQLHAVNNLVNLARSDGSGGKYLIQHSAGSGKSNTIAWLAHRLSQLQDQNDERIFNTIIVISDRKILNAQLQHTVRQYEKTRGLVETIEKNSSELKSALESGKQIIVTTLQKFQYIMDSIGKLSDRRFALLIDEAHSSQGGTMQQGVTKVLTSDGEEKSDTYEDLIAAEMAARGHSKNLSIFAFTATPKAKTLALFGKVSADGNPGPHSLYSMRQAIEEGFIRDVLENYTTYKVLWKLNKEAVEDPEVESPKAKAILRKFVKEDKQTIAHKVDIMMTHFTQHSMNEIGGQAKAMIATSSRLQAVQFRLSVDKWISENGFEFKALVAFTDSVPFDGEEYTEHGMNGVNDDQTANEFEKPESRILIVANKYQTGFDQPLLHTMYVDKKLGGVAAVQTLSRLNRHHELKTNTCIIDFANEAQAIQEAFQPYYEGTYLERDINPQQIYTLKKQILEYDLYSEKEAEDFTRLYLDKKSTHADIVAFLSPLVYRFDSELDPEEKATFRSNLRSYVSGYAFLARVISFTDQRLEEFFQFARFIVSLLQLEPSEFPLHIKDLVLLEAINFSQTSQGSIPLTEGPGTLSPPGLAKPAIASEEELDALSRIVAALNERHGAQLTEDDKIMMHSLMQELTADASLSRALEVNPPATVKGVFTDRMTEKIIGKLAKHEGFVARYLNDAPFQADFMAMVFEQVALNNTLSEETRLLNLLHQGESSIAEFKSSLRWNLQEQTKDKRVTYQCIKAVAGFLNSRYGGTLYIGVNDDGEVLGLDPDGFADIDSAIQHLTNALVTNIGLEKSAQVMQRGHEVEGKNIIVVEVPPALTTPTYCRGPTKRDDPIFYVRVGASTRAFNDQEKENYISQHFN